MNHEHKALDDRPVRREWILTLPHFPIEDAEPDMPPGDTADIDRWYE